MMAIWNKLKLCKFIVRNYNVKYIVLLTIQEALHKHTYLVLLHQLQKNMG